MSENNEMLEVNVPQKVSLHALCGETFLKEIKNVPANTDRGQCFMKYVLLVARP